MIDPHRLLWLHFLHLAFTDATAGSSGWSRGHRESADQWIRDCGRDFRHVCSLAGMDADFLSGAYRAGRVNPERLRSLGLADIQPGMTKAEKARIYAARHHARARSMAGGDL